MKQIKLFKTTFIFSLVIFTACSTKEPKLSNNTELKELSIYNIIGITEPKKNSKKNNNITFFIKDNISSLEQIPVKISPDIEYISYQAEEIISNKINIDMLELNAKSFLGIPYVWGATGPNKFDCSGFTQWVYRDMGINIPRISREQARVGKYVRYEDLEKGDMVFFDTKRRRAGKVTHVGIYLGNGDFIHASSAGKKVVIYNFNQKSFYKDRFLWGRRVTQNNFEYALK